MKKNRRCGVRCLVPLSSFGNLDGSLNLSHLFVPHPFLPSFHPSDLLLGHFKMWVCVLTCMLSHFCCVQFFATLWTVACQASLSMGFSGQEYWNGLPLFSSGDLPDPGMKPICPALAVGFPHPTPNLVWMSRLVMSHTHTPRSYEIFIAYVIEVSLWRAGLKCLETRERAWLSFYCG